MGEFFRTTKLDDALSQVLSNISEIVRTEEIQTYQGLGRVVCRSFCSPEDLPGFKRSRMDGYAVRSEDTFEASEYDPVLLEVVGEISMGEDAAKYFPLGSEEAMVISTGGMLPPGADAVVMIEETELIEPHRIELYSPVAYGGNVTSKDEDISKGEEVIAKGELLNSQRIGSLLGVGITSVEVFDRGKIGIVSTGNELIPPDQKPEPGEIRDINSYTLLNQLDERYTEVHLHGIVPDSPHRLIELISETIKVDDLLLISGGSSVGVRDMTLNVLEDLGEIIIHGLQMAPGKPTLAAVVESKLVIGLPGNPVSSMVVCDKFVLPIVRKLSGGTKVKVGRPTLKAVLTKSVSSVKGREDYIRVKIENREGEVTVSPLYAHSNIISSLSKADGLVRIKASNEGLSSGEEVTVELW